MFNLSATTLGEGYDVVLIGTKTILLLSGYLNFTSTDIIINIFSNNKTSKEGLIVNEATDPYSDAYFYMHNEIETEQYGRTIALDNWVEYTFSWKTYSPDAYLKIYTTSFTDVVIFGPTNTTKLLSNSGLREISLYGTAVVEFKQRALYELPKTSTS